MPTAFKRQWRRMVVALPIGARLRPLDIFVGSLCFLSGLVNILGVADRGSIYDLLPSLFWKFWGLVLIVGSGGLLFGVVKSKLIAEKFGLRVLSIACVFYGVIIIVAAGVTVGTTFATTLSFWFAALSEVRVNLIKQAIKPARREH